MKIKKVIIHIKDFFENKAKRFDILSYLGFYNWMSDEAYIKKKFYIKMGYKLDLDNPAKFNEKLQWLKLHNHKTLYTELADKNEAKRIIAELIGEEYIIPTLGVYSQFDEIDFEILPKQFVLKCNHDSGGIVIVKDKDNFDKTAAKSKLGKSLKRNFYYWGRERQYKDIRPCIIAEKYMQDDNGMDELTDYKFFCFDGYVDCVMVCLDRSVGDTKFYFFDKKWNLKRINKRGLEAPKSFTIPKPKCMDKMFAIAEKLSKGIPFVRVDLYQCNGKVYFGEMTFYPQSGFDPNLLPQTDLYLGDLLDLSAIK